MVQSAESTPGGLFFLILVRILFASVITCLGLPERAENQLQRQPPGIYDKDGIGILVVEQPVGNIIPKIRTQLVAE